MAGRNHSVWPLVAAALLFAATVTAQQTCSSAKFPSGRSFQRCTSLPVLGASLHWTYHPANVTADVAFRAPQSADGWVAWGINPGRFGGMSGSSVFVASQDGSGAVSILMTHLESYSPTPTNNTLRLTVHAGPAAEYSGGAYTVYVTVALPGNSTVQNTVWQAGPVSKGQIMPHPTSAANLQSAQKLDFLSGSRSTGAPNSRMHRRNLRGFQG